MPKQQPFYIDVDQAVSVLYKASQVHDFNTWAKPALEIAKDLVKKSADRKGEEILYSVAVNVLYAGQSHKMIPGLNKGYREIMDAWKLLRYTRVGPFEAAIENLDPNADAIRGNSQVISRHVQTIRA